MKKELLIQGMHCAACQALISMEIEELGLLDKILSLEIIKGDSKGKLVLDNVSEDQIEKIKIAINSLENYKII